MDMTGSFLMREELQAVSYKKSGMDHVVWFEDVRSIQAKWKLVQELDLAGAWYWNLMRKFRGNWLMLESPDAGRNT